MHKDIGFLLKPIQPWREYDAKLTLFTQSNGLVDLTAFGLLGRSIRRAALLQPFNLLNLHWESPNPPFNTLTDVTLIERFPLATEQTIACGWYLNELTLYCLDGIESESYPNLLSAIQQALTKLLPPLDQIQSLLEATLRQFESSILAYQGYDLYANLPELPRSAQQPHFQYDFDHGWQIEHHGLTFDQLIELNSTENWQTLSHEKSLLTILKQMHRRLINQLLGNRAFKSRSYFSPS